MGVGLPQLSPSFAIHVLLLTIDEGDAVGTWFKSGDPTGTADIIPWGGMGYYPTLLVHASRGKCDSLS